MKAIILAAGYATRLYPLTIDTPKQLIQIGNKLMIEHIINKLEEIKELKEIYIVTNAKFYSKFIEWKQNYNCSKPIIIHNDGTTSNEDRLGAVGDINFVIKAEKIKDDLFIIAGDNLFELNLNEIVHEFKKHGKSIVAARDLGDKSKLAKRFGVIVNDSKNNIIDFEEKPALPKTSLASTMIYLLNKESVNIISKIYDSGKMFDNGGDLIHELVNSIGVKCFIFNSAWYDIGSHEQLEEVHNLYSQHQDL